MRRSRTARLAILAIVFAAMIAAFLSEKVDAQSEFMRGEGMPYAAFDRLPATDIAIAGAVIHVGFAPGPLALPKEAVLDWVRQSAKAVTTYYGRFPVASLRLLIVPMPGPRVQGGTTWGYRGGAIRIRLGQQADAADLKRDWVMVHEMLHLALPDMPARYNWLSEGLAVYVEPMARAQAGGLTEQKIWADMVRDMPNGLPQPGDGGLDGSDSWGRIYWGGALFCLTADIEIRKATGNRLGLQDAMRGVLAAGGNHEVDWPIRRILRTADAAVGLTVLTDLYDASRATPVKPDLARLWHSLGVEAAAGGVRFDEHAPLAALRASLIRRPQT